MPLQWQNGERVAENFPWPSLKDLHQLLPTIEVENIPNVSKNPLKSDSLPLNSESVSLQEFTDDLPSSSPSKKKSKKVKKRTTLEDFDSTPILSLSSKRKKR